MIVVAIVLLTITYIASMYIGWVGASEVDTLETDGAAQTYYRAALAFQTGLFIIVSLILIFGEITWTS